MRQNISCSTFFFEHKTFYLSCDDPCLSVTDARVPGDGGHAFCPLTSLTPVPPVAAAPPVNRCSGTGSGQKPPPRCTSMPSRKAMLRDASSDGVAPLRNSLLFLVSRLDKHLRRWLPLKPQPSNLNLQHSFPQTCAKLFRDCYKECVFFF